MIGNLVQSNFFPKFLISIDELLPGFYIDTKEDPAFLLLFYLFPCLLFKEEVVLLSVYALSMSL